MTLNELLKTIDTLSAEELALLRERITQREREVVERKIEEFDRVIEALREGLTEEQLDLIEWAMNVETIQPPDDSLWQE
jgi:hypothetical protein